MLTRTQIRSLFVANGETPTDILFIVVDDGREFPDAVRAVTDALNLDAEGVAEMVDGYDNQAR